MDTFGSTKGAGAYSSEDSSPPQKFVTAYMDDDARTEFLRGVQSHYSTMGIQSNTIVYDGSKKVFFDSLMDETNMLSEIIKEDEDYKIVVGESLGTVKPIYIEFEPIGKNNLLLVDSQQELARHLFMTYVKCLLICKERDSEFKSVSPFIFFADYRIRKRSVKQNDELADLCLGCEEIYYGTTDSDIEMIMRTLYDEYKLRDSTNAISQPLFLVLFGLQNISKILDTFDGEVDSEATSSLFEENEDSNLNDLFNDDVEEKKSVGQIFRLLLQNGSKRSIFLLTWMDNNQSIKKLEYGDSDYFGNKILGKMSADDSDALVGMSIAAHITETQLIFSNINSEVQKLKHYL